MDCSLTREALSARLDGEPEPVPAASVGAHLEGCSDCRLWYARAGDHTRRLREIAFQGGLRGQSVPAAEELGAKGRPRATLRPVTLWARGALAVVGVVMLALTVVQMTAASEWHADVTGSHLLGESAAWSIAVGAATIFAAVWPAAAAGLSGTLVVYTAALLVSVVTDAAQGVVSPVRELGHLPVMVAAVLALLVWRGTRTPRPSPRGAGALQEDDNPALYAVRTGRAAQRHPQGGSAA